MRWGGCIKTCSRSVVGGWSRVVGIFQETILFVIRDPAASTLRTDDEIIRHFKYRFQMIRYQVMKDNQQLKEVNYADNIQAQNGSSETEE